MFTAIVSIGAMAHFSGGRQPVANDDSIINYSSSVLIAQLILRIVGLMTAGLILVVGIVILVGALIPASVPSNYRTILGVVMVLYGTYRILMILIRQRSKRHEAE